MRTRLIPIIAAATALLAPIALAPIASAATKAAATARRADAADLVAGSYAGSVIADTRGGSRSDVNVTVKRIGKNLVRVSSDYDRIPTVDIALTRAMDAVLAARPGHGFLVERAKNPRRLDLSIDGATWMGYKE